MTKSRSGWRASRRFTRWELSKNLRVGDTIFEVPSGENLPVLHTPTRDGGQHFVMPGSHCRLGVAMVTSWPTTDPLEVGLKLHAEMLRQALGTSVAEAEVVHGGRVWRLRRPLDPRIESDLPLLEVRPELPLVDPDPDWASASDAALRDHFGAEPVGTWEAPWEGMLDRRLGPPPHLVKVVAYTQDDTWTFATVGLASAPTPHHEVPALTVELTVQLARTTPTPPAWGARLLVLLASQLTAVPEVPRAWSVLDADVVPPLGQLLPGGILFVTSGLPAAVVPDGEIPFLAVIPLSPGEVQLARQVSDRALAGRLFREAPPPRVDPSRPDLAQDLGLLATLVDVATPDRTIDGLVRIDRLPDGALELHLEGPLDEVLQRFDTQAPLRLQGPGGEVVLHPARHTGFLREIGTARFAVGVPPYPWRRGLEAAVAPALTAAAVGRVELVQAEPIDPRERLRERARRFLRVAHHVRDDAPEVPGLRHTFPVSRARFDRALLEYADPDQAEALARIRDGGLGIMRAAAVLPLGADALDPEDEALVAWVEQHPTTRMVRAAEAEQRHRELANQATGSRSCPQCGTENPWGTLGRVVVCRSCGLVSAWQPRGSEEHVPAYGEGIVPAQRPPTGARFPVRERLLADHHRQHVPRSLRGRQP